MEKKHHRWYYKSKICLTFFHFQIQNNISIIYNTKHLPAPLCLESDPEPFAVKHRVWFGLKLGFQKWKHKQTPGSDYSRKSDLLDYSISNTCNFKLADFLGLNILQIAFILFSIMFFYDLHKISLKFRYRSGTMCFFRFTCTWTILLTLNQGIESLNLFYITSVLEHFHLSKLTNKIIIFSHFAQAFCGESDVSNHFGRNIFLTFGPSRRYFVFFAF